MRAPTSFIMKGVLPFLKNKGWALLNVAMWWKQYIGSGELAPHRPSEPAASEKEAASLPIVPMSA